MIAFPLAVATGCAADATSDDAESDEAAQTASDAVDRDTPATFALDGARYNKVSSISRIDFSVALSERTRRSKVISFTIPNDAVGFAVHILDGDDAKNPSFVYDLVDPNGKAVIAPEPEGVPAEVRRKAFRGQAVAPNAMLPEVFAPMSSTNVPNAPGVKVVPGKWKLRIEEEALVPEARPRKKNVAIVIKRSAEGSPADRADVIGVVRVRLHATPDSVLGGDLRTAPRTILNTRFADFTKFYKKQRLVFDVQEVIPLPAEEDKATMDAAGGPPGPNERFIGLMRREKKTGAINLFALKPSNYVGYAGIATLGTASAVWTKDNDFFGGVILQDNVDFKVQQTLAHELGHNLGLFHTSCDHLPDTSAFEHYYEGPQSYAPNLMTEGAGELVLSPSQRAVVHANAAVTWYQRQR